MVRSSTFHTARNTFAAVALIMTLNCSAETTGSVASGAGETKGARWSVQQANDWYEKQPWLVGCNFSPSTAINQLEMWQEDTFDAETIDRELGWAEDIGFTSIRVYLHDIPWKQDSKGYIKRLEKFLEIADKHKIGTMFVIWDSVWHPNPKAGKQPDPKPHVHNSGWVQSPGVEILGDDKKHDELKPYVVGLLQHFKDDKRVQAWDLFNEPDNTNDNSYKALELPNKAEHALVLLNKTFQWAREVNPSQPLTSAVWMGDWGDPEKLSPMQKAQLEQSDVISFHNYSNLESMTSAVQSLRQYKRPLICTEYMARPAGSTFDPILGYLKKENVGAHNWGFVSGKSQTIYPWDSWKKTYTAEPPVWFHDIFRPDGKPYRPEEVEYIKSLTRDAAAKK